MSNLFLLADMSEVLNLFILKEVENDLRRRTNSQRLSLMPRYHKSTLRLKHPKFQELLGKRLTRKDPEGGYLRTRLSILQISLTAPLKHQSWYLDSGCSRHITGERHLFQRLELKAGGVVGFGGNQKGKIIGSGTIGYGKSSSIKNVLLVEGHF